MADRIIELKTRLDPIIMAGITAREAKLINAIREVTDEAIKNGQYGSSRMALGLEAVYRNEFILRNLLVWETWIQAIDGFRPYQPNELAHDFKHFINEHLESSRVKLAHELKERSGKQSQENEIFNNRFEMRDLSEEQLRSYGAKIDLWAMQQQTELKEVATERHTHRMQRALNWIWRFFKLLVGKP